MEIFVSVVGKIAECAVEPVARQLGYQFFYRSNVENLKTQVKNLQEVRERVQHEIDEATWNAEEIETDVRSWLSRVDGIVEEAYVFYEEEGHQKVHCSKGSCPNLWTRHRFSRKAKKMTQVVMEIQAQGKFERVAHRPTPTGMRAAQPAKDYKALHSRTNTIHQILEALKDASIHTIGVWGIGGVGKTTLAKEVGRLAKEQKLFDVVVMTTITEKPDLERIQEEIAYLLGLRLDVHTKMAKADKLRERIKKEKRILVIVDDIWEGFDLDEFGIPLADEHKGCKLLTTSRNLDVLRRDMGIQKGFELEVLQEDEAWSLFEKAAGDAVNDPNLQPIAAEVVKRCAGLPILVVAVGKALRYKEIYAWKNALKQLERFDKDGLHGKVYSALEVSFNHLETEEHKSFFLLIGLRGHYKVYKFSLLIFSLWLGLIKNLDSVEDARNRVQTLANDLKASSLLLEAETGWVVMHDVVREFCMSMARKHLKFLNFAEFKEWPSIDMLKGCRAIFLPTGNFHYLPERLECPDLQVLTLENENLKDYMQVSDSFFEETRDVKYIDLVYLNCTPKLPTSIGLLKNLRALTFYYCMVEDIALVGELTNLEMLGFDGCNIRQFPKELGKLHRLRFLDMKHCTQLQVIPPKVLSNLTMLEELYMGDSFHNWEAEGASNENTNASLNELKDLQHLTTIDMYIPDAKVWPADLIFEKLLRFGIFIGDVWKSSYWSGEDECWYANGANESKTLKLKLNRSIQSEHGLKLLMKNVDHLFLDELKGVKNVLCDLNSDGFSLLNHLTVQNNGEVKCIAMSSSHPLYAYANLQSLVLYNLCSLEHVCDGPLAGESFSKLRVIKVQKCDRLKYIFPNSMIKVLPHLADMEVSECKVIEAIVDTGGENLDIEFSELRSLTMHGLPALISFCSYEAKEIVKGDNPPSATIPLFNPKVSFPILEKMVITGMETLMTMWNHYQVYQTSFCQLKTVEIKGCEKLVTIFPSSILSNLYSLETLTVSNCSSVVEIFEEPNDGKACGGMSIQLKSLSLVQLPKLKQIWNYTDLQGTFNLQNLEKVYIEDCPALKYIFPISVAEHLGELRELMIQTSPTIVLYG